MIAVCHIANKDDDDDGGGGGDDVIYVVRDWPC